MNLDEIRARVEQATPGPWTVPDDEMIETTRRGALRRLRDGFATEADAEFLAHAREDVPALLAIVADLAAALKSADETCSRLHDLVWQHQQQCGAFREVRPNDLIWLIHDTLRAALGKVEAR